MLGTSTSLLIRRPGCRGPEMTTHLLSAREMGGHPQKFYAVATAPGLLAGMSYPRNPRWSSLHAGGYRYVICLTDDVAKYDPAALTVLFAAHLQDQAGGIGPERPDREERCIREAVSLIVPH